MKLILINDGVHMKLREDYGTKALGLEKLSMLSLVNLHFYDVLWT